ncbi:hypothetical protein Rhe02_86980 [Rhizocola hellebori]|uniref:PPE domain-containing protein n=1 Tax=Rhizocola hellebori TaxID=1392758 RepID=A0A8J3VLY9_9ACTN|nr:hypothetical protein [Rhizocola hellebori]GIH10631.1 hypothetical protein Rhe02_86980 [Rhizocola hellebori]
MDSDNLGTYARITEPDPLWAEVVERVICDGRPGYVRDAADRYEHLVRRWHDEATTIEDALGELAQSWDGAAFAAYRAAIERIVADMRLAATGARAIVDALRLAADLLRSHQERIPVPVRLGGQVFRVHYQRRDSAGGVAPSNADFEQAVHADVVEREPWLPAPQALEQATLLFQEQQNVARRVYRELSAAYDAAAALLPALPMAQPEPMMVVQEETVTVKQGPSKHRPDKDLNLDEDTDRADNATYVVAELGVLDLADIEETELPVAVALGAEADGTFHSAGNLSSIGPAPGAGPSDTGASFGVPVSMMNTPGVHTGMGMGTGTPGINTGLGMHTGVGPGLGATPGAGMHTGMGTGMGTHMSTPMGSGYGGVIGGIGESDPNSNWLTENDDDPSGQDGQSSGAVLS